VIALVIVIGVRVGTLRVGTKVARAGGAVVALNVTTGAEAGGVGDSGIAAAQATRLPPRITTLQRATHRKKFNAERRGVINTALL
jgi:hypothetical protein